VIKVTKIRERETEVSTPWIGGLGRQRPYQNIPANGVFSTGGRLSTDQQNLIVEESLKKNRPGGFTKKVDGLHS
jgi:hypothetical protein